MPSSRREPLDPMAALRRFRTLVEQSVDVIMLVGPTGELLYASLAASSVLGYAPGENLGRAAFELGHPRAVARELHDDFGPVLTALKLNLQRRDRDDAETIALVDGAIARMRELAQDLRPPLLDEFGLEASLGWYVEREARRAGLDFRLALAPLARRPPIAVETTCFRIAQEALTNVVRHAQARPVEVELRAANGTLLLAGRGDGQGFDVAAARRRAAQGGSQGLLSMQERATLADGDVDIDSTPGRGTAIRARLPRTARGDA